MKILEILKILERKFSLYGSREIRNINFINPQNSRKFQNIFKITNFKNCNFLKIKIAKIKN